MAVSSSSALSSPPILRFEALESLGGMADTPLSGPIYKHWAPIPDEYKGGLGARSHAALAFLRSARMAD
jgi:hypothetical protein